MNALARILPIALFSLVGCVVTGPRVSESVLRSLFEEEWE
jgi:hypothetical protein